MTLPMTWDEWAQHDGIVFAARVRKGEVTPAELAAQAAAGIAKINPTLSGAVEMFEDVIANPAKDGANLEGPFAGLEERKASLVELHVRTRSWVAARASQQTPQRDDQCLL